MREFRKVGSKVYAMDMWAIGMVIIEILVGTDLTLPLLDMNTVEEMLDILEDTVDEGTSSVAASM